MVAALAACGGDDSNQQVDAAPTADAANAVRMVDCTGATIAQTVTTTNFAFTPASITINTNDVVRFMPESIHNVIPHPTMSTDPGLRSGAVGEVRCLQFTTAGQFNYRCQPHANMNGSVTVN